MIFLSWHEAQDHDSLSYFCFFHQLFCVIFSLAIFSIQSTHGLLSVDDDFQNYYLTFWRREAQLFLKCDWWKPVKLCIIPILLLHDCCGMLKKSCVINLKVTHSPEILSWSVSFMKEPTCHKLQITSEFCSFCWNYPSAPWYIEVIWLPLLISLCVSVPTISWKTDWFNWSFVGKQIVLVISWQSKEDHSFS